MTSTWPYKSGKPHHLPGDAQHYATFVDAQNRILERATLNGVRFYIDPQELQYTHEWYHQEVGTRTGFGRWNYGLKPVTITLRGTTGTAGRRNMPGQDLEAMIQKFMPLVGSRDIPVPFEFKPRFDHTLMVYVNRFNDSMTSDSPLYHFYDIELMEAPPASYDPRNSNIAVTAQGIEINLPVGG